jgi:hypothetical protein
MMPGLPGAEGTDQGRPIPVPVAAHVTHDRCPISDTQQSYKETLYRKVLSPFLILKPEKKKTLPERRFKFVFKTI